VNRLRVRRLERIYSSVACQACGHCPGDPLPLPIEERAKRLLDQVQQSRDAAVARARSVPATRRNLGEWYLLGESGGLLELDTAQVVAWLQSELV
jgi:hypothetical protein